MKIVKFMRMKQEFKDKLHQQLVQSNLPSTGPKNNCITIFNAIPQEIGSIPDTFMER